MPERPNDPYATPPLEKDPMPGFIVLAVVALLVGVGLFFAFQNHVFG